MLRRLFPEDSNQFNFLQNIFKSFDKEFIDRLEMFFPMWCMFAYQHYLVKSFDIAIFRSMEINLNTNYVFSMIREDWIGIANILFHTILFLWLMKRFDTFGLFRTVKSDFQTNFLLFLALFSLIDIFFFGKMMIGFFLMNVVLYVIYRSDSYFSIFLALSLTVIVLFLSLSSSAFSPNGALVIIIPNKNNTITAPIYTITITKPTNSADNNKKITAVIVSVKTKATAA